MPILVRFLPSEATLIDIALACADPDKPPRSKLFKRIRQSISALILVSPGYFLAMVFILLIRTLVASAHYPLTAWLWNAGGFVLSVWFAIEALYFEEYLSRFGL